MQASYIIPTHNSIHGIERIARAVLGQTLPGLEVVFFDQGSTDGTKELIHKLIKETDHPNAHLLLCPPTPLAGTCMGFNIDYDFIHSTLSGDLIILSCADDTAAPNRAERLLTTYEKHQPSWLGNKQYYESQEGTPTGETAYPPTTGFVTFADNITHNIGSSGGLAWSHAFYERVKPLVGIEANDVILPALAPFDRGFYYLSEPLTTYTQWRRKDNCGLEGQLKAAESNEEKLQLAELTNYHVASMWQSIFARLHAMQILPRLSENDLNTLFHKLQETGANWTQARDVMSLYGIPPLAFGYRCLKPRPLPPIQF